MRSEAPRPSPGESESSARRRRRRRLACAVFLGGLLVAFAGAEAVARWRGLRPWREHPQHPERAYHERDAERGWRLRPGRYEVPPFSERGRPYRVTVLPGGRRWTGEPTGRRRPRLAVLGGSYTFGAGVDDGESYPARLQQLLPSVEVDNYGVNGYGTVQCLATLRRVLRGARPPRWVLYGFLAWHEERNVGSARWLAMLAWNGPGVSTPYATLGPEGLRLHPPEAYRLWPLQRASALVNAVQQTVAARQTAQRVAQAAAVTVELVLQMNALCRAQGVDFRVVFLLVPPERQRAYRSTFEAQGLRCIDANHPLGPAWSLPGDPHPNARLHAWYAERIADALRDDLSRPTAGASSAPDRRAPPQEEDRPR
ncbi:MAG: hypothetical protein D6731_06875 [Planctomycetota bacterium]|nr:MAG: hypothetical protein D6731_06875 [Planctomycetota bacterium]